MHGRGSEGDERSYGYAHGASRPAFFLRFQAGMKWTPGGRSSNLEDRRGRGMGGPLGIGGGLIMLVLALIFGPDVISNGSDGADSYGDVGAGLSPADSAREEPMVQFVSFVLDDAQKTWAEAFQSAGQAY